MDIYNRIDIDALFVEPDNILGLVEQNFPVCFPVSFNTVWDFVQNAVASRPTRVFELSLLSGMTFDRVKHVLKSEGKPGDGVATDQSRIVEALGFEGAFGCTGEVWLAQTADATMRSLLEGKSHEHSS